MKIGTLKIPIVSLKGKALYPFKGILCSPDPKGSRKNNFTFYAPQGHLLRGTSRIQVIFGRYSTPKSSK